MTKISCFELQEGPKKTQTYISFDKIESLLVELSLSTG
jgi:hypothetical protein